MSKKASRRTFLKVISAAVLLIAGVALLVFINYHPFGYRISVGVHGFSQAAPNVYFNNGYSHDKEEALAIITEARERVEGFFGEVSSNPVIIICDDEHALKKMGGATTAMSIAIFRVHSYILISPQWLNVDILAHEISHAEVFNIVYNGKIRKPDLIPTWFDEGVALLNDYREEYGEEAWIKATNNGQDTISLDDIDTPDKFFTIEDSEKLKLHYIVSGHEVRNWIEKNGIEALFDLLKKVNHGNKFRELYFQALFNCFQCINIGR